MCDFSKDIYPEEDCNNIVFGRGKYSGFNRDAFITIDENNDYNICVNPGDPYEWGWVIRIIFCPYCGRKLKKEKDDD